MRAKSPTKIWHDVVRCVWDYEACRESGGFLELEELIVKERPSWVSLLGDTWEDKSLG